MCGKSLLIDVNLAKLIFCLINMCKCIEILSVIFSNFVARGMEFQDPTDADPKKIDWSQIMDQFFVELMLDEVRKGNKVCRTFKKKSWITMITCFNEKFGFQHGRAVLKNRYNVLRKHYSSVNALLDQKGFTWDETQQKVVADDPVWNKYIEVYLNCS